MTGTGISKTVITASMLQDVNTRFGRLGCIDEVSKFTKVQLITKGGILINMDDIDRIYVEY